MPLIRLAALPNVVVDVLAWALVHSVSGYAVHRVPLRRLQRDNWLLRPRAFERNGRFYVRVAIRRWKDAVPEAGAIFGGISKRRLPDRHEGGLERFVAENRRGELGHWLAMAGGPLFVLWNPPLAAAVMVVYGVVINAPFIAIQRYNRLRALRLLARDSRSPDDR